MVSSWACVSVAHNHEDGSQTATTGQPDAGRRASAQTFRPFNRTRLKGGLAVGVMGAAAAFGVAFVGRPAPAAVGFGFLFTWLAFVLAFWGQRGVVTWLGSLLLTFALFAGLGGLAVGAIEFASSTEREAPRVAVSGPGAESVKFANWRLGLGGALEGEMAVAGSRLDGEVTWTGFNGEVKVGEGRLLYPSARPGQTIKVATDLSYTSIGANRLEVYVPRVIP